MSGSQRRAASPSGSDTRAQRRAREAHERGLRAAAAGHPAVGARQLRTGLTQLGWVETTPGAGTVLPEQHHALAARLLMSLAHFEAEQGRIEYGLGLLDQAESLAAPADRGVLLSQRGLIFMRTWQGDNALAALDGAVALLDGNKAETAVLARTLLNRAFHHLNTGHVRRARADLVWCHRIAASEGFRLIAAKTVHNQGYCDLLAGDIPAALALFNAAAESYRLEAPGFLPVLATDKARALLAVGLTGDAARELDAAIAAFRQQRLDQDLADAELTRSQVALAAGDLVTARRRAATAQRRFHRRGNEPCAALAELTLLRARALARGRPGPVAAQARLLTSRLRRCALSNDADLAELTGVRALVAAGRRGEARQRIATVRRRGPAVSLDVSLLRRLAQAELAELEGRPGAALATLREGLAMVHTRRGRLGSLDLQTGTATLGTDLAAAGLRLALDRGTASLVFAWLERSRAQAFRIRPVRPPADPHAAAVLAELRQLSYLNRQHQLSGHRDPAAIARHAELQREVREHSWQASGLGDTTPPASVAEVHAALGESRQSLVSMVASDSRVLAVVLRNETVRLLPLGDFDAAAEAARRLTADLDTLAGRRLPARLDAVIRESIRHQVQVLTTEIAAPLRSSLGDDGAVLVPTGALAGIPWGLLPDMRGRPVTVCPSASSWVAAWRRRGTAPPSPPATAPLLVAGPDLAHSAREVERLASVYPGSLRLLADDATVSATLRALDGAPVAHLAAHGHHDLENVLFSRLDLADGPLMAYDVQQLTTAPRLVVLSACDVGRTVVRPGEEILGFTAALLYIGTPSVISSVTRVADEDAEAIMLRCHQALRAGAGPAEALAQAALTEPFSPFICFGAG
jgi:tetratricopeptide (TPR) repeat protein